MEEDMISFTDLGLSEKLVKACEKQLRWYSPVKIQTQVIPLVLQGQKDVIGLSPPHSGKTVAFVLPILDALLETGPYSNTFFACVITASSDTAREVAHLFETLGSQFGVKCSLLIGGYDMVYQSTYIANRPHIIVGTSDRVLDHLKQTPRFSFRRLKYLVVDEADLLLTVNFEKQLNEILGMTCSKRRTFLFASKMTKKVHKIQKACLRNPKKIDVSSKYSNVDTLKQQFCYMSSWQKDCYLVYILTKMTGSTSMVVFAASCERTLLLAWILTKFNLKAIPINGYMSQSKRLKALEKLKSGECNILFCDDVASRGLDIPVVDMVINYDIPRDPKDYIRRVGRTSRVGVAISLMNVHELDRLKMIEAHIGKKLSKHPTQEKEILLLEERVSTATRLAEKKMEKSGWGYNWSKAKGDLGLVNAYKYFGLN